MIEIIPRPIQKLPLWQNILFYLSIVFLVVTISLYFVFDHLQKKSTVSLQNLQNLISQEKTSEGVALEKEVFNYQKKIQDFSQLLSKHLYPSNFFKFIEENCHPKVWFSQISLNPEQAEVNLVGEAENFTAIGQQILIFKSSPSVRNVVLAQISIGKRGRVDFGLNLSFDQNILK